MISVFMIDTVGAHRGMHYYNFPLTSELQNSGVAMNLISTWETAQSDLCPENIQVLPGFRGIYGEAPRFVRGFRYALSLLKILRFVKIKSPEIVHFHFFQIPILDYFFFKVLASMSVQRIITVHDVVPFSFGSDVREARNSYLHKLYQNASGLILNSTHALEKLKELDEALLKKAVFIQQGSYTQSKLGALQPSAEAKASLGLKESTPVVLIFGTIKPNKRLDLVIEAMSLVVKNIPYAHLLIAGKLQDRDVTLDVQLAQSLGIDTNIVWKLGRATDDEMIAYFSAADVVIFPYQWIYQSAALLMAMSLGKAVVATAVGSNNDVIVDGKTGLLVSPEDARETAVAIEKLLTNPEYANQLSATGKKDVDQRFNWKSIAAETEQFYLKILGE
ncbi:glycosyltransferase family 4 protein [Candidatus Leptofilum sp.]|uniref:glycosyltransferase family 4 protein n=1 Tax=Candidatus Leptofilum sp. TaxID=3241576 RepID=UPI003B5AA6D7